MSLSMNQRLGVQQPEQAELNLNFIDELKNNIDISDRQETAKNRSEIKSHSDPVPSLGELKKTPKQVNKGPEYFLL